jgi:hypothetical protein
MLSAAKHLLFLIKTDKKQILRFAQDDILEAFPQPDYFQSRKRREKHNMREMNGKTVKNRHCPATVSDEKRL